MITDMNNRLKQFLAAENISQAQFADSINVVRASVSHVLSGRNNPSYDFIKAIMGRYPTLSIEWLMLGKGKMYKSNPKESETETADTLFNDFYEDTSTAQEPEISVQPVEVNEISQSLTSTETSTNNTQTAIKQRKVSRIIVLFDDGSFQEM